ncbi:rhomboid family intramembrane serine protease [Paracoccaceae bacterium]|jgi:membrane associated rhomboid family serine protease|nr:rhomboid family intramembrane serine protease [Paracoccaceae bacterium]
MSFNPETPKAAALNPMPPVVMALFLMIAGVEALFALASIGVLGEGFDASWRFFAIERYGINTNLVSWMRETQDYGAEHLVRFVTFSFLHASFMQAAIACALFLAMGKMVGSVFSAPAVLMFFFVSAALGALVYCLIAPEAGWLFGAFPGIYGLIGAYTFLLWVSLKAQQAPAGKAFNMIAMLIGIQLVFGIFLSGRLLWIADLAGFLGGFTLSVLLLPGGLARLMQALRRD